MCEGEVKIYMCRRGVKRSGNRGFLESGKKKEKKDGDESEMEKAEYLRTRRDKD